MDVHSRPLRREGLTGRIAPFVIAALLVVALALVSPAAHGRDELTAAAILTGAILAAVLLVPWGRLPSGLQAIPPIAFLGVVALLVDGAGGGSSPYLPLTLVPGLWLALYGTRIELSVFLAAAGIMMVAPILLVGPPEYPASQWKVALVWFFVGSVVALIVHRLVGHARDQAEQAARSAEKARRSEQRYRTIVETANEGAWIIAPDARIVFANARLAEQLGYGSPAELEGRPFHDFMDEESRERADAGHRRRQRGLKDQYDLRFTRRDGSDLWAIVSGAPLTDADGSYSGALALITDITERRVGERQLAARHAVAGALAEAESMEVAAPRILAALGETLGWQLAELWIEQEEDRTLRCSAQWQEPGIAAAAFVNLARDAAVTPGMGLPGRVWETREPVWTEDVTTEPGFLRAQLAADAGLHAAVCAPIVGAGRALGAIALFSDEPRRREPALVDLLVGVSEQVGQFIRRRWAEQEVADQAANLAVVISATHDISGAAGPRAARPAICRAARKVSGAAVAELFEPEGEHHLVLTAIEGANMPVDTRIAIGEESSGAVAAYLSKEPLFVEDARTSPIVSHRFTEAVEAVSIHFEPVLSDERVIGVLTAVWSEQLKGLSDRSVSALRLLAAEAAIALERADLLARLEEVARTDELTGLPNRRAWGEQLRQEMARARRDGNPLCVALLDLDFFKHYNDQRGHQAGDRLLKQAAAAWLDKLRATDTIARYGGEEFTVLLPGCSLDHAGRIVEGLRGVMPEEQTCSAGVALWDGSESGSALVARADAALYEAKEAGRDRMLAAA